MTFNIDKVEDDSEKQKAETKDMFGFSHGWYEHLKWTLSIIVH